MGYWGLSVHWQLDSVLLGLDLSGCVGLACCESFSLSTADFLSEMKLKASFSAVSQFAVLALTQSSKVLKEIDLLFVFSMVLKEGALLTSCSMSWKVTFYLPDLPMVLKAVSLPLFLTMSLTLLALSFYLMTIMSSTPGVLKGVDMCLSCSLLSHVLAGVLKGVTVHFPLMTLMPSTLRVLPYVSLAGVLKGVSVHVHIAMVLKELDGWS